jgi:hypothetical protein
VKNALAPKSVQDFINFLKDLTKSNASNYKNRSIFLLVVRYFDPLTGLKNRFLDCVEQADETPNAIQNLMKSSLDTHKLDIINLISCCADNAGVTYGRHNSVFKLLQKYNKKHA